MKSAISVGAQCAVLIFIVYGAGSRVAAFLPAAAAGNTVNLSGARVHAVWVGFCAQRKTLRSFPFSGPEREGAGGDLHFMCTQEDYMVREFPVARRTLRCCRSALYYIRNRNSSSSIDVRSRGRPEPPPRSSSSSHPYEYGCGDERERRRRENGFLPFLLYDLRFSCTT